MKTEDICSLTVPSADDSVLLLWATFPQLEEAFKVIKAWGFLYKTCAFTWVKLNQNGSKFMGMGRYTRANAEICLLATKGNGIPRKNASIPNTQMYYRTKHSEKPWQFRREIEKLFGSVSRLELFARQKTEGWDVWGNELESDIEL